MAFNIDQRVFSVDGEFREETAFRYREQLMDLFVASPEGQAALADLAALGWADTMMEYAMTYLGVAPPGITPAGLRELLLEIFPRKVIAEPGSGVDIVTELRAFWEFLDREFHLPYAAVCAELLDDAMARQVEREMHNPSRFGMAKSFLSLGRQRGFDMGSPEEMDEFTALYNAELLAGAGEPWPFVEPVPALSYSAPALPYTPNHPVHAKSKVTKARRKMAKASQKINRKRK